MQIQTATATINEPGPLVKVVNEYSATHGRLVDAGISQPSDWQPLAEFIATDEFKRVGAYLEVFDWDEYLAFLTDWASGGTQFEMTLLRISEVGNIVVQEIEERHRRGDEFIRKNVVAIYAFNADNKIRHLDIYEQARDSGQWIIAAAEGASAGDA